MTLHTDGYRHRSRLWLKSLLIALPLAMLCGPAFAVKHTGGEFNTLYAGTGVKGYDVVAYFTDGKPQLGSEDYVVDYGGVTWRFVSQEHRDLFVAEPEKYVPQFGGFCTWGVGAADRLFDVDPVDGWTIYEGKLYMNFNADLNKTFRDDPAGLIAKAQKNWPALNQ